MAARIAGAVISWNTIRFTSTRLGGFSTCCRCQADRLAFAILVSRQVQHIRFGEQFLELGDLLRLSGDTT